MYRQVGGISVPPAMRVGDGPANPLAEGARRRRSHFDSPLAAYENFARKPPLSDLSPAALSAYVRYGFEEQPDGSVELRCRPEVAMGDAIIALTTNIAINNNIRGEAGYVKFKEEWFDLDSDSTPDGSSVEKEYQQLVKGQ